MDLESKYYFKILYPNNKLSVVIEARETIMENCYLHLKMEFSDLSSKTLFFLT